MLSHKILRLGNVITLSDCVFKLEMLDWLLKNCPGRYIYERYPGNRCYAIGFASGSKSTATS